MYRPRNTGPGKISCNIIKNIVISLSAWFVGQEVKTPPSQGGITGSIPVRTVFKSSSLYKKDGVFSLIKNKKSLEKSRYL